MKKYLTNKNLIITVTSLIVVGINTLYLVKDINLTSIIILLLNFIITVVVIWSHIKRFGNKEKRELNKIKASFLSNISHEIKTPLNGIMGMNNLLKNSKLSDDQKEYSNIISSCGESLLTTINDILDFSKIEEGILKIDYITFDLRKLLNDFYNMNYLTAELKGLHFDYFIDSDTSNYFIGDPGRVRQILSNLYNNAVKFTSEGEIELTCEIIEEDEIFSTIKFSIKDSGIGISKDKIETIFRPFTQGDSSISKEHKGIGLGLSMSKQLVNLMGGQLDVNSTVAEGTEFSFTLKLKREAQLLQPKTQVDIAESKCLIVHSDNINMKKLSADLTHISIENRVVKTFRETLELIKNIDFNWIIFDMKMSKTEDLKIKEFVESIKENSKISLVALTSEGQRGDGELCRSLHIDGYLVCPFNTTALYETLSITMANNSSYELVTKHTLLENRKSNVKILIVDDNNINLMIAQKLLSKMGYHSETALGGREAIQLLKETKFDLIFMDIQMPVMDGLQTTTAIRNEEAGFDNKEIPIIALTANTTPTDRLHCSQVGMNDFLTKPYQPKLLSESINKYVKWNII